MSIWDWIFRPRPPQKPKPWTEHLSVLGVAPEVEVRATLRVDDGTAYSGVRDTSVQGQHRMRFTISNPDLAGWGCHVDVEAHGYASQMNMRYIIGNRDHELEPPVTMVESAIPPPVTKRTGVVMSDGKATVDDGGQWHPLGASFFWAMQGWKWERERMKQNAAWLRLKGFDYVRILCLVGWPNRDIDPSKPHWSDYDQVLAEVIDFLYDECGLRVELTIDGKDTPNNRVKITERIVDIVSYRREHKVVNFEMVNEYTVGADISTSEMLRMAEVVRAELPNIIALSSPGSWEDLERAASGSGGVVDGFTVHIDRGTGDGKWRQVRQGYDFKNVRQWVSSNEPPGPASSVATNDDPLQLAMMRAVGVMCGGSAYVLHTGTGVYGDGRPHPTAGPRPANFWEIPNIEAICAALRGIDALLPAGVENWKVANTGWTPPNPVAPLQPHETWENFHGEGVNKAYSATSPDGQWIQMPCGVLHHVTMRASYPLTEVTVYDPMSLQPVPGFENMTLAEGQTFTLPGAADAHVAYIIHGRR